MKTKLLLIATLLLVATAAASASPLDPRQIDARAQWVVHIDTDACIASPLGEAFHAEFQKYGVDRKLAALEAMFSFDPMQDLRSITIYGIGYTDRDGIVLIAGKFDVPKLTILLRASDAYEKTNYTGHEVHHWIDHHPLMSTDNADTAAAALDGITNINVENANDTRHMYAIFYRPTLVVLAGNLDMLKVAVDVLDARKPTLATAKTYVAQQAKPTPGSLLMAVADGFTAVPDATPEATLLKKTQRFATNFGQTGDTLFAEGTLTAQNAETAQQIEAMFQGMVASVLLSRDSWPELAVAVQTAVISRKEASVSVRITYPTARLIEMAKVQLQQYTDKRSGKTPTTQPTTSQTAK